MTASKKPTLALGILLGTLSAFGPLSMDLYLPALPAMQTGLHTTTALVQMTITASLIGLALGQIILGPLSDRFGRRGPLLMGVAIFAVTSVLIALQTNVWVILALRVVQGIGGSSGQVLSRSIARDFYSGKQLTSFMALLMAINGIFPIISPSIGSLVLLVTDWRGIFYFLALIGLLLVIATWVMIPETLAVSKRSRNLGHAFLEMGGLLKERDFMTYVIAQGFAYGALFSYIAGSTFVIQGYYHVPVMLFAILYAVNGLGIILGTNVASRIADRFTTRHAMRVALIGAMVVGLWLVGSTLIFDNLITLAVGLFAMQVCFGGVNATATSLGMNDQPTRAGGASALLGLGSNAIAGVASPLVGLLGAENAVPMVGLILGFNVLAFLTFSVGISRRRGD